MSLNISFKTDLMDQTPLVSVVIPLYNKGPHIERAIESVLSQSMQDFEVIVIDGGSTDDGPDIIMSHDDERIKLLRQTGKGVSNARNEGIRESKAELIAFLDADDEWMPFHLETILELRSKYPQAGAYTTSYAMNRNGKNKPTGIFKKYPSSDGIITNYFELQNIEIQPVWTSVACIPKEILLEVGGFPENHWFGEDLDCWGKIALDYPVAFSKYIGGVYHMESINRVCDSDPPLCREPFVDTIMERMDSGVLPDSYFSVLQKYLVIREVHRSFVLGDRFTPKESGFNLREVYQRFDLGDHYRVFVIMNRMLPKKNVPTRKIKYVLFAIYRAMITYDD